MNERNEQKNLFVLGLIARDKKKMRSKKKENNNNNII